MVRFLSRSQYFSSWSRWQRAIFSRLVKTAVEDNERGMGSIWSCDYRRSGKSFLPRWPAEMPEERLNAVELGVLTTEPDDKGQLVIDLSVAEECIQRNVRLIMTEMGIIITIISLLLLKVCVGQIRMQQFFILPGCLYAGEDPKFIARRIMICASEDVGNADPQALVVAVAASQGSRTNRNARSKNYYYHRQQLMLPVHRKAMRVLWP